MSARNVQETVLDVEAGQVVEYDVQIAEYGARAPAWRGVAGPHHGVTSHGDVRQSLIVIADPARLRRFDLVVLLVL